MESEINQRKDKWNKILFKGAAKEALIDDIEKSNIVLTQNLDSLLNKLKETDFLINGLDAVTKVMIDNPDYELRKASIKKL